MHGNHGNIEQAHDIIKAIKWNDLLDGPEKQGGILAKHIEIEKISKDVGIPITKIKSYNDFIFNSQVDASNNLVSYQGVSKKCFYPFIFSTNKFISYIKKFLNHLFDVFYRHAETGGEGTFPYLYSLATKDYDPSYVALLGYAYL